MLRTYVRGGSGGCGQLGCGQHGFLPGKSRGLRSRCLQPSWAMVIPSMAYVIRPKTNDKVGRRPPTHSASSAARVPPHNLQAEESLLGAMLLSRDAIVSAVEVQL